MKTKTLLRTFVLALPVACALLAGCSAESTDDAAEVAAAQRTSAPPPPSAPADAGRADAAPAAARDETRTVSAREDVWIFSADLRTKLGCITCGRFDSDSVWNPYGSYGSQYGANSLWNKFGTYGSPYSSSSPWNAFASSPPVLYNADRSAYYGVLTSAYGSGRTRLYDAERLLAGGPDQDR